MALFKPKHHVQRTVAEQIDAHMRAVKELFPGSKMSLVVRSPAFADPMIFTNDQPEDIIAAVRKMMEKPKNVTVAE